MTTFPPPASASAFVSGKGREGCETRQQIRTRLQTECGGSEEGAILLDRLEDLWETFDVLKEHLGGQEATHIVLAPCCT